MPSNKGKKKGGKKKGGKKNTAEGKKKHADNSVNVVDGVAEGVADAGAPIKSTKAVPLIRRLSSHFESNIDLLSCDVCSAILRPVIIFIFILVNPD